VRFHAGPVIERGLSLVANPGHLALLQQGVEVWNTWRAKESLVSPDLSGAKLSRADLDDANFGGANLGGANLVQASLVKANFGGANLILRGETQGSKPYPSEPQLGEPLPSDAPRVGSPPAELRRGAPHRGGPQRRKPQRSGPLPHKPHRGVPLQANLARAYLFGANLLRANLTQANLSGANLSKANLSSASLVETNLEDAKLTDCRIYGISAWNVKLNERTKQQGLIITPRGKPAVTVDDLEVAQFVYLLLGNEKVRRVIETITSKVVLILGRFTPERKAVLDAIRKELRNRHYVPILFDFDLPAGRDITETVSLLARMARFIIADLTEPSSIPKELEATVPHLRPATSDARGYCVDHRLLRTGSANFSRSARRARTMTSCRREVRLSARGLTPSSIRLGRGS
jgi:uncharacterized protein YjbI with pentapeptide repeats